MGLQRGDHAADLVPRGLLSGPQSWPRCGVVAEFKLSFPRVPRPTVANKGRRAMQTCI
jgi:hypothetical protein